MGIGICDVYPTLKALRGKGVVSISGIHCSINAKRKHGSLPNLLDQVTFSMTSVTFEVDI